MSTLINASTDDADAGELAFSAGTAPESAEVWRSYVEPGRAASLTCEAVGPPGAGASMPSMEAVLLRMPAPGQKGKTPA